MIRRRTRPAPCPLARARAVSALLLALAAVAAPCAADALLPIANASGEALYLRECAPCHGAAGHGDGPEAPTFVDAPRDLGDLARAEPSPRIVERVRRSRLRMLAIDEAVVADRRKRMVEELVGHLQRMPDVPWPLVRRGADVYAERCETCHGPNGRPVALTFFQRGPAPSGVRAGEVGADAGRQPPPDFQKAHGDAELIRTARGDGHPAMPGFTPARSDEDARALLAYLRVLSNGFTWYSLWCAGCHGDEGRGDGPLATGIDQPHVVLDRGYLSAQSPADLRRKAMHVFTDDEPATPHFQRDVSAGQARAVLAAVRALQGAEAAAPPTPALPAPVASLVPVASVTPAPSVSRAPAPSRTVAKPAKPKAATVKKAPPKKTVKSKPKPRPTPKVKQKAKAKPQPAATKKAPPRPTPSPDRIEAP